MLKSKNKNKTPPEDLKSRYRLGHCGFKVILLVSYDSWSHWRIYHIVNLPQNCYLFLSIQESHLILRSGRGNWCHPVLSIRALLPPPKACLTESPPLGPGPLLHLPHQGWVSRKVTNTQTSHSGWLWIPLRLCGIPQTYWSDRHKAFDSSPHMQTRLLPTLGSWQGGKEGDTEMKKIVCVWADGEERSRL